MKALLFILLVMVWCSRESVETPKPPEPKGGCSIIVTTRGAIVVCS
jgi:hypothetical protein